MAKLKQDEIMALTRMRDKLTDNLAVSKDSRAEEQISVAINVEDRIARRLGYHWDPFKGRYSEREDNS